jgi:hypothetical protein
VVWHNNHANPPARWLQLSTRYRRFAENGSYYRNDNTTGKTIKKVVNFTKNIIMRTILLSLAISLASFSSTHAQSVLESIDAVPVTPLPYNTNCAKPKLDQFIEPYRMHVFPYELWNGKLNINLWKDFNLTQSRPNNNLEDVCLYRRLPGTTAYHLCVLMITCWGDEDGKKIMVTVNPATGALIDQLEVGYVLNAQGVPDYTAYTKEFFVEIVNNETIVSVSQMKLMKNKTHPISLAFTESSYLVKKNYRINSKTGKFELIEENTYPRRPKPRSVFFSDSKAFQ